MVKVILGIVLGLALSFVGHALAQSWGNREWDNRVNSNNERRYERRLLETSPYLAPRPCP